MNCVELYALNVWFFLHCLDLRSWGIEIVYFLGVVIWGLEGNHANGFVLLLCATRAESLEEVDCDFKLQQHFLYIAEFCCSIELMTSCNVNVM